MNISEVSVPEIYETSSDFRLFIRWFSTALSKIQHDTENLPDIYDPLKCPDWLLWMLCDTMGFKYDDRLPTAFNRLVLVYFMSMIRNRGSKDGVTLAAEVNLAQFNVLEYGKEKDILYNRLEDTSIPVNAAYVTPHTAEGYIDVVYFSSKEPVDACIEYVRPVGMYLFATPGVRFDARTKISIDARLTNTKDIGTTMGPTRVGHYTRDDYARLQKMTDEDTMTLNSADGRDPAWYRNSEYEVTPTINAGYRALSSLQLCNNEHIVKALLDPDDPSSERPPIFGLGYTPTDVEVFYGDIPLKPDADRPYAWNLRYDKGNDDTTDVYTLDPDRTVPGDYTHPKPQINPIMFSVGDAMVMDSTNTQYTKTAEPDILVEENDNDIVTTNDNNIDLTNDHSIDIVNNGE
jgi:hypothetical protein